MEEKLLLFGGKPTAYLEEWSITADLALAERKLGVRFEEIPHAELLEAFGSLDPAGREEAAALAQKLISGAEGGLGRDGLSWDDVEAGARLAVAMRQLTAAHGGDAVTVGCGPWIRDAELPTPCLALMTLQEAGVPAACQGDIDALLTMVLFKRVTDAPAFMGGARRTAGHLGISHCVLCRHLAKGREPEFAWEPSQGFLQPYSLHDYHGRKPGPTVRTRAPVGETVTIARLTRDLAQLLLTTGTVIASHTGIRHCRNTLVIDVADRERVLGAVRGVQNHYVVAYGDHREALRAQARAAGIPVVDLQT
jgi:L-fucose isomerase-like protein